MSSTQSEWISLPLTAEIPLLEAIIKSLNWCYQPVISPSSCLKRIEQDCSFDSLTFQLCNFLTFVLDLEVKIRPICCDMSVFLNYPCHNAFPGFNETFVLRISSLPACLFFLKTEMSLNKINNTSAFIMMWKGQRESWRKCFKTRHTRKKLPVPQPWVCFKRIF